MNIIPEWSDAFGSQVAARTNVLDLASHYPYSPERWRLFVDGARQFPGYNTVAQYTHDTDRHRLSPAGGETVVFESAERPRYVVQYELAATFAFAVNQSLTGNDRIRIGLYDGSDGWYIEHRGDHADGSTGDAVMERDGSEVYRVEGVDLHKPVTAFARLKLQTGWYDITRQRWERSYARDGDQVNPVITEHGAPGERGPQTGNLPLHFEVTADASTTGLDLLAGSAAQVNLGRTTQLTRTKVFEDNYTFATTGSWVPILAIRTDPDRDIINTQLSNVTISEWGGSDDVNLLVQAHDPSKVLDGGGATLDDADYSTPAVLNAQNNIIEISSAVEQAADGTGSPTTSTADPGGYQVGWASQRQSGQGSQSKVTNRSLEAKRSLYGRDTAVVWGYADNAAEVTYEVRTEQDW